MTFIKKTAEYISSRTIGHSAALLVAAALLLFSGCQKDSAPKEFGGPARVCLMLSAPQGNGATKATISNETDLVKSIRIYAFKNDPANNANHNECVGYAYFSDLEEYISNTAGEQTYYYCPMDLSASGEIDFYVITNDGYAALTDGTAALTESSSRAQIEAFRFSGLSEDADGKSWIPMSNLKTDGAGTDANNFTYNVIEPVTGNVVIEQVIDVKVTRAIARLTMYFAKNDGNTEVNVSKVTLTKNGGQGPVSTVVFSATGAPGFGAISEEVLLSDATDITKVNGNSNFDDAAFQTGINPETYMLPNTYGSSNPNSFLNSGVSDTDSETNTYKLTVEYTINGQPATKEIYLPVINPNDWVKVKCIINTKVDVELQIILRKWNEITNNVPPFV